MKIKELTGPRDRTARDREYERTRRETHHLLQVWISKSEWREIQEAAHAHGMKPAAFVRHMLQKGKDDLMGRKFLEM